MDNVPKDKAVVLLGRDMGPVLPLLKSEGFDARYFLWSSIQADGPETVKQWRKEIPPGASVVDTGYAGSIIHRIKNNADPTIEGFLLSKNENVMYRQVLGHNHRETASRIEGIPKIVGRSTTYREHGGAVTRITNREQNDVTSTAKFLGGTDRWSAMRQMREVYRELGLF